MVSLFAPFALKAQNDVQINISVLPPYSAYIQDYAGAGKQVQIFVRNTTANRLQVRLQGSVTGDNGVQIQTVPNYRPPVPLTLEPFQNRLLSYADLSGLFDLNQLDIQGVDRNNLYRGLPLPEGSYQLCIRAFDNATSRPLSPENPLGCSPPFPIKAVEPPILIAPFCDSEVQVLTPQNIVFTWTPPVGVSPAMVDYTLRIVELPLASSDPNVFIDAVVLPKSGVEVRNLKTSTFLFSVVQPQLIPGKKYAWRVQARDLSGRTNFLNDGKSPVCAFTYGQAPIITPADSKTATKYVLKSGELPVKCSCENGPTGDLSTEKPNNANVLASRQATVAGFSLSLLDNVQETDGLLNGDGMIPLPLVNSQYARLRVRLYNVQCNAAGQVISGVVRARYSDKADPSLKPNWDNPDYKPPVLSSDQISNISKTLTDNKDMLVSSLKNSANSIGFEVPFGIDKTIGPVQTIISITNVTFAPKNAFYDARTWITLPQKPGGFNGIPLSGFNICMSPDKPFCGEGIMYLGENMELTKFLNLKGGVVGPFTKIEEAMAKITYVQFDTEGFKRMGIRAGLKPPKMLRAKANADSPAGSPAELLASTEIETPDFDNWVADVTFDDFYIDGLSDFVFSSGGTKATYDHSQNTNPGTMPADYDAGKTPDWTGLFIPKLSITIPFLKSLNNGKDVPVGVQNMIYDSNGFTGDAVAGDEANPLVGLGNGNLASWYCSADQLKITFFQSGFKSSSMVGRVVLPLFKYDKGMDQNAIWPYTCTLTKGDGGMQYQFNITPKENVKTDVWRATLKLNKDLTHILVSNKSGGFVAEAALDGEFSINTGTFLAPGITFTGLTLTTEAPYLKHDGLKIKFASPPKDIAGMPFNLSNLAMSPVSGKGGQFDFGFTGSLELTEASSLTASTTARVRFAAGLSSGRPNWEYKDFLVDHISGSGVIGPLSASVDVDFYHDDAKYGNGFGGKATLGLGFVGGLAVQAKFGKTMGDAGYRYWYIGGTAVFPAGGIPIGTTPVAFKGFGGGAFSHMKQVTNKKGEIDYDPDPVSKFGVTASIILGTVGTNLLNVNGGLTMTFDDKLAPTFVGIHGDGYLLADSPPTYNNPLAKGTIDINYDIAKDIFDAKGSLSAGFGSRNAVSVEAVAREVGLRIKPKEGKWFFSLGTPNERLSLDVYIASQSPTFTFGSYLLTGNDLPPNMGPLPPSPYGLTAKTLSDLKYKKQDISSLIASKTPLLAFGASYSAAAEYNVGPFFLNFNGALGYDLVMAHTDEPCNGKVPGINGWYTSGQFYAYLKFALGIDVDLWVYSGRITAVELEAGALLQGGAVNPIWFHGNVFLKYRVLNGLVKGKMNMDFWYNKDGQCKPAYTPPNPFADQPLIARLGPSTTKDETVSTLTPLYAEFNYPINSEMVIDAITPEGKSLHRRFKLLFKPGESFETGLARKSGPGGYEACANDQTGRLTYGKEGSEDEGEVYTATFYRKSALPPNSQYDLNLGAEVWHEYTPDDNDPDYKSGWHVYRYKKINVDQSEQVSFKTGECLTGLTRDGNENATVLFSYPFEGQRYFMRKDGSGYGVMMLAAKMCCMNNLASDKYFTLKVRMTPYQNGEIKPTKAGGVLYADAKFVDNNRFEYKMPDLLKAKTLYAIDLVRVPTPLYISEQEGLAQQAKQKAIVATNINKYVGALATGGGSSNNATPVVNASVSGGALASNSAGGQSVVNKTTVVGNVYNAKVETKIQTLTEAEYLKQLKETGTRSVKYNEKLTDLSKFKMTYQQDKPDPEQLALKYEQVLYSYYFKTSQYERMEEKLKAIAMNNAQQKTYPVVRNGYDRDNSYVVAFTSTEHFDTFELEPQLVSNGSFLIQPMVNVKDGSYNNWWKDFGFDMFSSMIPVSPETKHVGSFFDAQQRLLSIVGPEQGWNAPELPLEKWKVDAAFLVNGLFGN